MSHRVEFVELTRIRESIWNPNEMEPETFESLKQDMNENGAYGIKPIDIFPVGLDRGQVVYQISDGHHRFRAAKELKWLKLRAEIHDGMTEAQAKVLNYRRNRERGKLNPAKEAQLFFDDWKDGKGKLTQEEIADKYGVSQQLISERLGLLTAASPVIQKLVEDRELPPSHAEEIYHTVVKPEVQEVVARVVSEEKLSPEQTKQLAEAVAAVPTEKVEREARKIAKDLKAEAKGVLHPAPTEAFRRKLIRRLDETAKAVRDLIPRECPYCHKTVGVTLDRDLQPWER